MSKFLIIPFAFFVFGCNAMNGWMGQGEMRIESPDGQEEIDLRVGKPQITQAIERSSE